MKNQTHRIMATMLMASMLAMLVPMTADSAEAAGESWLGGWNYRAAAPINAASGAGTGYQVLFHLYAGSGANGVETYQGIPATKLYLNNHAKADWGDLRFTAADGKSVLPYWIESSTATEATVWVKLSADISTAGTTVYCYYGNAAAGSQSNGANVFEWFSNFDASESDRLATWTNSDRNGATVSYENGIMSITRTKGDPYTYTTTSWGPNTAAVVRMAFPMMTSTTGATATFRDEAGNDIAGLQAHSNVNTLVVRKDQAWSTNPDTNVAADGTFHRYEIQRLSDSIKCSKDGTAMTSSPFTTTMPTTSLPFGWYNIGATTIKVDYLAVRKVVATEPTHATPGAQVGGSLVFTSAPSVANIIKTVDGRTITASVVAENYTSIVWDMGDNTTYTGVTQVRHDYADNGTYTVTVTAYDWLGQEASTSTAVKIGDTIPVMSINGAGMAVIAAAGSFVLALGAIARRPVVLLIGIAAIIIAALLALGVL